MIVKGGESRRLSLATGGSSIRAALGDESKAGVRGPALCEVDHSGAGPNAFVAAQPVGKVGGVTLSKPSPITPTLQSIGIGIGVGVALGVGVGLGVGLGVGGGLGVGVMDGVGDGLGVGVALHTA